MSRVVRTARTRQEKHEKDRAKHAYYTHIHDEVTISDVFPAIIQGLEEDENFTEDTTAQDVQEDETEQSLSGSSQTRRQISKIHENMGHPSNRTLVRVLRLGGAKRRFILAAAHMRASCRFTRRRFETTHGGVLDMSTGGGEGGGGALSLSSFLSLLLSLLRSLPPPPFLFLFSLSLLFSLLFSSLLANKHCIKHGSTNTASNFEV